MEVTDPGDPHPGRVARGADLRTDLPQYRIFRRGTPAGEARRITDLLRGNYHTVPLGRGFPVFWGLPAPRVTHRPPPPNDPTPIEFFYMRVTAAGEAIR